MLLGGGNFPLGIGTRTGEVAGARAPITVID